MREGETSGMDSECADVEITISCTRRVVESDTAIHIMTEHIRPNRLRWRHRRPKASKNVGIGRYIADKRFLPRSSVLYCSMS